MTKIRATAASLPARLGDLKANAIFAAGMLGTILLVWHLNAMANQIYLAAA